MSIDKLSVVPKASLAKLSSLYVGILTLYRPVFRSYRNQSVDLRCKSTDWFLYDENIG